MGERQVYFLGDFAFLPPELDKVGKGGKIFCDIPPLNIILALQAQAIGGDIWMHLALQRYETDVDTSLRQDFPN